jgi:hypothetical protein
MSLLAAKRQPHVKWGQDYDRLFLTLEFADPVEPKDCCISVQDNTVVCTTPNYELRLECAHDLDSDRIVKRAFRAKSLQLVVVKRERKAWGQLSKVKMPNVRIDWWEWPLVSSLFLARFLICLQSVALHECLAGTIGLM